MIIAYLGQNVKDYAKNFLAYLEKLELICPGCDGFTTYHATYRRSIQEGELVEQITIQRVLCKDCEKTHAVIPDFIRPYKRYSAGDSEKALRDLEQGTGVEQVETPASLATLRRWQAEFQGKAHEAVGALKSLLYRLHQKTIGELELAGKRWFELMDRMLEEFGRIKSSDLAISKTNQLITSYLVGVFL